MDGGIEPLFLLHEFFISQYHSVEVSSFAQSPQIKMYTVSHLQQLLLSDLRLEIVQELFPSCAQPVQLDDSEPIHLRILRGRLCQNLRRFFGASRLRILQGGDQAKGIAPAAERLNPSQDSG